MSQIAQINAGVMRQDVQQATPQGGTGAPAELHGARPSAAALAGRIVAGIFTLGISEGIRAIVHHARAGAAPEPRAPVQDLPPAQPRADIFNRSLADGLAHGNVPVEHQAAVREAFDELRARFGADLVPNGATLGTLPGGFSLRTELGSALQAAPDEVSAPALRALILEKGAGVMGEQALQKRMGDYSAGIGYSEGRSNLLQSHFLQGAADLRAKLRGCGDRAAVERVLDTAMPRVTAYINLKQAISNAQAQAKEAAITHLAEATGLSEAAVRRQVSLDKLETSFTYLVQDLLSGETSLEGEALSAAFQEKADRFVAQKSRLFASVDGLGLSPNLADMWKASALSERTLDDSELFVSFHAAGSQVDAGALLTALQAPAGEFSDREILGLMESLGARLENSLVEHYGAADWEQLGGDGQGNARYYAAQAMLDAVPGLQEALAARPELVDRLNSMAEQDMGAGFEQSSEDSPEGEQASVLMGAAMNARMMLLDPPAPAATHNEGLAASLGRAEMSLPHAVALDRGVAHLRAAFGEDCLPEGDSLQAMSAWNPVADSRVSSLLAATVRQAASPVSSEDLGAMLETSARPAAAYGACRSLLGGMARAMDLRVDAEGVSHVLGMLRKRHPELADALAGTRNRADVRSILDSLPEAGTLLRVENDIQAAWRGGLDHIYTAMSEATGLPEQTVRDRLNVVTIGRGGKYHYLQQAIHERCGKAETDPASMPSSHEILDGYKRITDTFLGGKTGLFASVDALGLSPELADHWKDDILTNSSLKSPDFLRHCVTIAGRMNDSGLTVALGEPAISNVEILGLFSSIGAQMDEMAHAVFPADELREMGSDETYSLNLYARQAFLDRNPNLVATLRANEDRLCEVYTQGEEQLSALQRNMGRVDHNSPQMQAIQAEYAAVSSGMAIIDSVLNVG